MVNTNIVLFSAYAKLPSGTASSEIYGVMALVVLIDIQTGKIVDAECTLSTRMAEKYVRQILVGMSVETDLDAVIGKLNSCYQGSAQKAIITALRMIYDKYMSYKRQHE